MKIGIDISQLAYQNTGVANYLQNLVLKLVENNEHEFVLFFSSLRREVPRQILELGDNPNVKLKILKFPQKALHVLWNVLHQVPVETFIGPVDLFITSDWTEPPANAKKATIIYDTIVYKFPQETSKNIVDVQKKKLKWVIKESNLIFCISESTKKDVQSILGIPEDRLKVIYPGLTV